MNRFQILKEEELLEEEMHQEDSVYSEVLEGPTTAVRLYLGGYSFKGYLSKIFNEAGLQQATLTIGMPPLLDSAPFDDLRGSIGKEFSFIDRGPYEDGVHKILVKNKSLHHRGGGIIVKLTGIIE